jgi:hypothetical protein
MKDMQDDASKERNDIDAAIIRLPTPKQTKFSHGKSHALVANMTLFVICSS